MATKGTKPAATPAAEVTLDQLLLAFLAQQKARIVFLAVGPKGGMVPLDNFISDVGIHTPPNWTLTITVVKAEDGANNPG